MNSKVTKILLYLPTSVLGVVCMLLQNHILETGYDEKGLMIRSNPALWVLWAVTGIFLLTVLLLLPRLGARGNYRMNFPRCALSGGVMIAAGVVMAFSGVNELVPGKGLALPLGGVAAGGMMVLCGLYRMKGKKPACWPDLLICVYYAAHLMASYRTWNADPQLQLYAFPLLAGVAVMLFSLHRARCTEGMIDRYRLVFSGFAGIFLCFAAMAGNQSVLFFMASGLWCAGGMCELKRFQKKRRVTQMRTEPAPEQTAQLEQSPDI